MNKTLFAGWKDVFSFTFSQTAKGKFKKTTLIMAAITLAVGMAISLIMAAVQKNSASTVLPIQKIYVVNNTDIDKLNMDSILSDRDRYPDTQFIDSTEDITSLVSSGVMGSKDAVLEITNDDEGYRVNFILPANTELDKSQAGDFFDNFRGVMEAGKVISSGIEEDKLTVVLSPIQVNKILAGEEVKSIGEEVMAQILPMLIMMLLYFVILIHGMNMGNAVSVEKTSKLMEMMLTMTRPYALILGKITALTTTAILQVAVIIISLVGGFFAGDYVGRTSIYPGYDNYILDVLKIMSSTGAANAFGFGAFVLFAVAIILSILFFFMLAAAAGSFAEKTEDVASMMGFFQLAIIAGFLASIMLSVRNIPWVNTLLRVVPLSGAFILPSDILLGKVTLLSGSLYLLLLAAFTIAAVLLAGKVYLNHIFYRGGKNKAKK